ncbi:MAG: hypothetical protein A3D74_00330 [Candidatus Levybacteria bacterium RIFCSPHIGHO2_02_FULL_37_13]|nr:MAG: hypothetical protein A3D74_00330 [Candidatus Levybacteria bacterium RIFCSPHIGHO2_02_FULL_37_13]OGH29755.1 MAG: hypothetical protein A3E40_03035 [Candidatus Levybacteria bacterium RIFCSPHIGHO2_12_FULL_37_9]OGH39427.1 MAG: hypothetical protein A3B41_01515 [Candidatus Levybacteria bacterium RIFCSPLOWO2_01_FULL_37_26]
MINLSYNLSPTLKSFLDKIELLRQKILLTPLSPKSELRLRWEATVNRIYWSMMIIAKPINKNMIVKQLTGQQNTGKRTQEHQVVKYKKALDYIKENWLVSDENITPKTIIALHSIASYGKFNSSQARLKELLDYLQSSTEHPVIQAGIAYIEIINISPFTEGNRQIACLLGLIFLYKSGYDFRGLLVLEEYLHKNTNSYSQNLTPYLESFTSTMITQLEKIIYSDLSSRGNLPSSFWQLNDRQKSIINFLENPDATITNKKVQNLFKISQITASRDLARLVALGQLFAHGKGRSVFYTRV